MACDFFVVVTARFRILYVFVLMELGRRRILHCNVTDHPNAEWAYQPRLIHHRPTPSIDTGFHQATECVAKPCWVDCTTSTGWKKIAA